MNKLPTTLSVGIMTAPQIDVSYNADGTFTLHGVTIGKDYHWERQEDQTFMGELKIIREPDGQMTAVNIISIEDYLVSVISSEMSASASLEFLKAAAVISRSWVMRQILNKEKLTANADVPPASPETDKGEVLITWQDHEDHTLYDVCADDHCQRYQGISRATNPNVQRAVWDTRGEVLSYNDEVCDCRFSKCCGGVTEEFSTCWQDIDMPYLQSFEDRDPKDGTILCDTHDTAILSQVLNNYDQETTDFFRWTVSYTQEQLSDLLSRKLDHNFGQILELKPLKRGKSGRIYELQIIGTKASMIIGKELTIRSALSESHLYSSAFEVEKSDDCSRFTLHGCGWGHGVGLCQIGAAVMGAKGYTYREILAHYYPNTTIVRS